MKIVKEKDASYVDYVSQVMDAKFNVILPKINTLMNVKLNPILAKLNQLANVMSRNVTSQQGGKGAKNENTREEDQSMNVEELVNT